MVSPTPRWLNGPRFQPSFQHVLAGFSVAILLVCTSGDAVAQCSRGGGGSQNARTTGSAGVLTRMLGPVSNASLASMMAQRNYANQQMLAMRSQAYQAQQQVLAMRQQQMRRQAETRYGQEQDLLAMRRQRADEKRAKRAERVAANLAKRDAENHSHGTGDASLVLVSKPDPISPDPFDDVSFEKAFAANPFR